MDLSISLTRKRPSFAHPDAMFKRRAHTAATTISQREFSKRIRFRDSRGYSFAVPLRADTIYEQYVRNGTIGDAGQGEPDSEAPLDTKNVMLYMRKPRTKQLVPLPSGELELLDLATQRVFEAHVSFVISSNMNKPGHIILDRLRDTGRISTKSNFTGKVLE
jgi:hypothetical protein